MTEEDSEKKTCLIKISSRTSVRQVINYSIDKIRSGWVVTFNAFQIELAKALQSCEIIKTRVPFLYQENKFITWEVPPSSKIDEEQESDEKDDKDSKVRIRTGISITLSKISFEITNEAGYQKPKPRQFLQPLPQRHRASDDYDAEVSYKKKRPRQKKNNSA